MGRLFVTLMICMIVGNISSASAVVVKKAVRPNIDVLVPHQAVYVIRLANKKDAVSVTGVRGRMVFEVTGSPCEGYTQNMRMVTRITDERGKQTLSDIRSSTWEKGNGGRFRFTSSQYFDKTLQEVVTGTATRKKNRRHIGVKISKPSEAVLDLPGNVLFPTEHSLAILQAARAGKQQLDVRIYDGSEQGQGFYQTYSYIGKKILPQNDAKRSKNKSQKALSRLGLAKLPSWPVAISYFNGKGNSDDTPPSYELSFRLYPNGVSRNLLINYGDFSVHGALDRIKYLRKTRCNRNKKR